ncbi:hypothetical protein PUN28_017740 [Cardiocondyla obscurior]|uniref:Uncharacterized protein n=1 Tax=Cardiocondyla obscurior TaxID=286306 RepID=A0AAW2EMR4_9HYME
MFRGHFFLSAGCTLPPLLIAGRIRLHDDWLKDSRLNDITNQLSDSYNSFSLFFPENHVRKAKTKSMISNVKKKLIKKKKIKRKKERRSTNLYTQLKKFKSRVLISISVSYYKLYTSSNFTRASHNHTDLANSSLPKT